MLDEYWNVGPTDGEIVVFENAILMIPLFPPEAISVARISVGAKCSTAGAVLDMALYRVVSPQFRRDFTAAERVDGDMTEESVDYEMMKRTGFLALSASFAPRHLVCEPNLWMLETVNYALGVACASAWTAQGGLTQSSLSNVWHRSSSYPLPNNISFKQQTNRNNTGTPAVVVRTIRACRRIAG